MNRTTRILSVGALTSILGIATLGGASTVRACSSPLDGIIQTPPCASAPLETTGPMEPGQTDTPPASDTIDVTSMIKDVLIGLVIF